MKRLLLLLLAVATLQAVAAAAPPPTTLRTEMERLHRLHQVSFVYDASLPVDAAYHGPALSSMSLRKALDTLFRGTGISYDLKGKHVVLRKKNDEGKTGNEKRRARSEKGRAESGKGKAGGGQLKTVSGYVRAESGEAIVNATVYDLTTRQGTTTNAYGFFSLSLPAGHHELRVGYPGFADRMVTVGLQADRRLDVALREDAALAEVVVNGDLNSPLVTTQTGKRSLTPGDIRTEQSLLSSPDVVKTLQRMSGVAEGVELASGLYVHGGGGDENLFLLDGTPLYSVNHTLGLFSAFNADVVKNVDFFKSGFPARYGGRLSSVVDVRTADGDFQRLHGSYRIGLLDGSFQLEGPLRKGKTSFNFGLRRSWLDLITRPVFAAYNNSNDKDDDDISVSYFFHDLNAKLTNVFSDRSRLSLSVYSGTDALHAKSVWNDSYGDNSSDRDVSRTRYDWGNLNAAADWQLLFSPRLFANLTAVYTHNRSRLHDSDDDRLLDDGTVTQQSGYSHSYRSVIDDLGLRTAFDYRPSPHHHVRLGADWTWHSFRPQTRNDRTWSYDQTDEAAVMGDTTAVTSRNHQLSTEWNAYGEDEMTLGDHWSLNAGLNASLFHVQDKSFTGLDPRLAMKWQPSPRLSVKLSWTAMTQYVHKISNSVLDLPSDYWVPTTARLRPMRSRQLTAGVYVQPDRHWLLSLEGYWKRSRHLLQYASWTGLEPPADSWDLSVMDGKGRSYGLELDAVYRAKALTLQGAYTLSWSRRRFADFYPHWFYDKFDNRHKATLSARWRISQKVSMTAVWTMHSGNRLTVPTQYVRMPEELTYGDPDEFIYEKPNNFSLPLYHRLDVGFDFRHATRHGHERVWNLSLYNAYCHLNSMWVDFKFSHEGRFEARNRAFIPIVPSFSYTIKF